MLSKNKFNIVFTVTNDLSFDRRMIRICSTLQSSGFNVKLIGRKLKSSQEIVQQNFQQIRLNCFFESGKLFYLEYNIRLFFYLLFSRKMDGLCAIDLDTIAPIVVVGKWKKSKLIYDAHELFHEVPEVVSRPRIQKFWKKWGAQFIPKVDLAYTVGERLAIYFSENYNIPFKTIRNVPFRRNEKIEYNPKKKIILYQGMINEGRGVKEMIDAIENFPSYQFWIAGIGDLFESLKAYAQKLNYSDRIKFLGFIQPEKLPELTAQASIGINLLENKGLSYYYSLANKTFDYLQAGIPSIQMNFPEYQSLQESYNCFLLIPELSKNAISEVLAEIEENDDKLLSIHKAAIMAAKDLHWEKESIKLIELYKGLFKL